MEEAVEDGLSVDEARDAEALARRGQEGSRKNNTGSGSVVVGDGNWDQAQEYFTGDVLHDRWREEAGRNYENERKQEGIMRMRGSRKEL